MELTDLCQELKNWFEVKKVFGTFEISGGTISLSELQTDQYYRIVGSVFNDGVHKYPDSGLKDETFEGAVWLMAVPPTVIKLLDKINAWENDYGDATKSPYSSESFGGYSYTKASGSSDRNGNYSSVNYKNMFRDELNRWRKV